MEYLIEWSLSGRAGDWYYQNNKKISRAEHGIKIYAEDFDKTGVSNIRRIEIRGRKNPKQEPVFYTRFSVTSPQNGSWRNSPSGGQNSKNKCGEDWINENVQGSNQPAVGSQGGGNFGLKRTTAAGGQGLSHDNNL